MARHTRILVTGATGAQGGATAAHLRARGLPVRAFTRTPDSTAAAALRALGVEVVQGDYDDGASVERALEHVSGVFSVQVPRLGDGESERRHASMLIRAAKQAGVQQFVQASVSGVDLYRTMPAGTEPLWDRVFWDTKQQIEEMAEAAAFPVLTVLRPTMFMDSFAAPKVRWTFPELAQGELVIALRPDIKLALIAVQDIGAFAAAAFAEPERFNGKRLELCGDRRTVPEIAATLREVTGRTVRAVCLSAEAALARGKHPVMVQHQAWADAVGYPATIESLTEYDVPLTTFGAWAAAHAEQLAQNS